MPSECLRRCLLAVSGLGLGLVITATSVTPLLSAEITKTAGTLFEPDVIRISGLIEFDDFPAFARVASTTSNAIVVLDSYGGKVGPSFDIAMLSRARGFSTYVEAGAICHSGCTSIWLSGYRKFVERGSELGFHPSSYVKDGERVPGSMVTSALMGWYYGQLGLPRELVIQIFEMDALSITVFDPEIIEYLGIDATVLEQESLGSIRSELAGTLSDGSKMHILTKTALLETTLKADAVVEIISLEKLPSSQDGKAVHKLIAENLNESSLSVEYMMTGQTGQLVMHNSLEQPLERFLFGLSKSDECERENKVSKVAIVKASRPVPPHAKAVLTFSQSDEDLLLKEFGEIEPSCLLLNVLLP